MPQIKNDYRKSASSPKGRDARDAALSLFVQQTLAESRAADAAKIARLRALRLKKEAEDHEAVKKRSRDRA